MIMRTPRPSHLRQAVRLRRRAFTLIEVLIAIAMLGALLASMYALSGNVLNARNAARERARQHLAATTLIDRIEADLSTCLVGDSAAGAGVRGDAMNLRILSRGVAAHLAADSARTTLAFSDLQETEIRFTESSGAVEIRRAALLPTVDSAGEPFWRLGALGEVRFRYYDGERWLDSFDSMAEGRLPAAIEIAIWFRSPRGEARDSLEENDPFAPLDDASTFGAADDEWPEDDWPEDDDAWAGFDGAPLPPPDRFRVISIPDPDGSDEAGVEFTPGGSDA